jgi:hypothetical protein
MRIIYAVELGGAAVADDIVDITFTDVQLKDSGGNVATITGTMTVDYTAATASGILTANLPSGSFAMSLSSASISHAAGGVVEYMFQDAQQDITYQAYWTGNLPTSINSIGLSVTTLPGGATDQYSKDPNHSTVTSVVVVCFAAGTLIRTPRKDVAVETLTAGDVIVTSSGAYRPVKWVGHRIIDCRSLPNATSVWPIRIAADAIAPGQPSQDLYVSPAHTICIDILGETLIHAGNLVNGASIAQVEVDTIDYWHVELESHDLLLANNLPAESYLEMGNREFFAANGAALDTDEAHPARTHADFCRPVMEPGSDLDFVRRRLLARAEGLGWTRSRDPELRLVADGVTIRPAAIECGSVFCLPAGVRDVRLVSDTFVPAHVGLPDARRLGVALLGLALVSDDETREIALTDPRLAEELHPEEARDGAHWRWTKGELPLHAEFFAGLSGPIELRVAHNDGARGWIAPVRGSRAAELRLVS